MPSYPKLATHFGTLPAMLGLSPSGESGNSLNKPIALNVHDPQAEYRVLQDLDSGFFAQDYVRGVIDTRKMWAKCQRSSPIKAQVSDSTLKPFKIN